MESRTRNLFWLSSLGFFIGCALLVFVALLYWKQKTQFQGALRWVDHTIDVQAVLEDLTTEQQKTEDRLLKCRPLALELRKGCLNESLQVRDQHLQKLESLVTDNPIQSRRIAALHSLLDQRRQIILASNVREGWTPAHQKHFHEIGDVIAGHIGDMHKTERSLLRSRKIASEDQLKGLDWPIVTGGLGSLLLIIITSLMLGTSVRQLRRKDRELRRQTRLLDLIIENLSDGLVVVNAENKFLYFNAAARKAIGVGPSDVVPSARAQHFGFCNPKDGTLLPNDQLPLSRAMRGEETNDFEMLVNNNEVKGNLLSFSGRPIKDELGVNHGAIVLFRDITLKKKIENERIELQMAALESARLKSFFLANVSHEIRTPMNGIMGMTDLLLETPLDEKQSTFVRLVKESCQSLLAVINDILDFSKIEAGKLDIEELDFSLARVVENTVQLLQMKASEKSIYLSSEVSPDLKTYYRGDPARLGQILLNLISNAIKFTQRGEVKVRVLDPRTRPAPLGKSTLRFEVQDTGIGMTDDQIGKLFQPFTQADSSTSRRFGGTGLGLSISKQLVELMGGRIGVHSEPQKGSTFWFELDLENCLPVVEKSPTAAPAPKSSPDLLSRKRRVLLAEDNPINQMIAVSNLQALGCEVKSVINGDEALEALKNGTFDLVLMDCQMPLLDGYETTRRWRAIEKETNHYTPIAAMTANAMQGDEEKCRLAGMDDYLSKPFTREKLEALLSRWIHLQDDPIPEFHEPSLNAGALKALAGLKDEKGQDLALALIELFLMSTPAELAKIEVFMQKRRRDDFRQACHSMKSGCANVGAVKLSEMCEWLETSDAGWPEMEAVFKGLQQEFEVVKQELKQRLGPASSAA